MKVQKRVILARRKVYHTVIWERYKEYVFDNPDDLMLFYGPVRKEVALKSLRALRLIHRLSTGY